MTIDLTRLSNRLNDNKILNWFKNYDKNIYNSLINHTKSGPSPQDNRFKAIEIYNIIKNNEQLNDEFSKFISSNYNELIITDEVPILARLMVPASTDENKIFTYYNPVLLMLPMKMILKSDDRLELKEATYSFISMHALYDFIIFKNKSYIEYVPRSLSNMTKLIDNQHWEINAYRIKNNINKPSNILSSLDNI